ncbi:VOC family protein [Pelagovum pacificum]|uniref:Glyoxalase n=1 Tax=Pelagovum pacificum TaxID=2588711 RepID=A0A5C5GEW3_9RHOB|nr:VOC family protein [Pelagovum pacificum]QQA43617.1 VOC family protein [Pelagovum pacificum]TNY33248.1 glyoxalase [Pelagovum pacificum]
MRIDAVSVTTTDMEATVAFYTALGFDFAGVDLSADHVEPAAAGIRLMIDSAALIEKLTGEVPRPANHAAFAILCDSPAEVDGKAAAVADAGFSVQTAPWDAFWGQRYATVVDPAGYHVDLFAPLP